MVNLTPVSWMILAEAALSQGYEPSRLDGGRAALDQVQTDPPDLLVLAGVGGDLSGVRLCEMLQANPRTRSIPVVILGEDSSPEARTLVFEAGAVAYLLEPLSSAEVTQCLRTQRQCLMLQSSHRPWPTVATSVSSPTLLTLLQKRLNQQSQHLHQQNQLLLAEVRERTLAEQALREEQEKSERLLLNVLPKAIAEQLKQGETNPAQRFEEATILFADIVGFTTLASHLPALTLVRLLSEVFSGFDRLAAQLGLEKIKTIGDAYMVAGGVPTCQPNHAEAIMEMAIAMNHEIRRFRRQDNKPLRLRIGINTGTVVAGVIGLHKFSYDLWGDAVNVASRMESQGLPGKIQVTESTYQRLQHKYRFEQWGKVHIKGKGDMMTYLFAGRRSPTP